jgi:outer membrane protein assembly factor BamB
LPTAPIIVEDRVYFGAQDGAVRSLNLGTGRPEWSAFTGGPVKYPPVFSLDDRRDYPFERIHVGSGDGYVYCFQAFDGKTNWRFRAAPIERMMPVYGTITSTWPVPSVLVQDNVVYAAAGISNHDGTHVYALDGGSGKIKWQNHSSAYKDDDQLPNGGVSVQGPMLLHNDAVHFASGNSPPIASYALKDGKFTPNNASRGKDLFVKNGKILGAGYPLYWRPEDDQFISTMELECPAGVLKVGMPQQNPSAESEFHMIDKKGAKVWSRDPLDKKKKFNPDIELGPLFQEFAAVAITKNAIVVTGVNRDKKDHLKIAAGLAAIDINTGKVIWRESLPAVPTAWGLAIAGGGENVVVTLMDGRVTAFAKDGNKLVTHEFNTRPR